MKKRIGILTSGGDCPGLNATIRGVAKACYEKFGEDVQIVGIEDGYYGLINNMCKEMKQSDFSGILTTGGTIFGTKRTPFKKMQVIEEDNVDKVKAMKETYKSRSSIACSPWAATALIRPQTSFQPRDLTLSACQNYRQRYLGHKRNIRLPYRC